MKFLCSVALTFIFVIGGFTSSPSSFAARAPAEWRPNKPISDDERKRIANGQFGGGASIGSVVEIQCPNCESFFGSPVERSWNLGVIRVPAEPKRIVIYFKGGEGDSLKFEPGSGVPSFGVGTDQAVAALREQNAVFFVDFDKPMHLRGRDYSPAERSEKNHHRLIDAVIDYAKKKHPELSVVMVGHSNGTVSINQYLKWLKKQERLDEISGIVLSATRDREVINSQGVPALAIGHEADPCRSDMGYRPGYTTPSVYKRISRFSEIAEVAWVTGGVSDRSQLGCRLGYHSYEGSEAQFTSAVQDFMDRNID